MAGWGGSFALVGGDAAAANNVRNVGRVLTFTLGGTAQLPPPPPAPEQPEGAPAQRTASAETVARGEALFTRNCVVCHGAGVVGGGVLPDLRYLHPDKQANFSAIVLHGALKDRGMPAFGQWLTEEDAQAILAYIRKRAADSLAAR